MPAVAAAGYARRLHAVRTEERRDGTSGRCCPQARRGRTRRVLTAGPLDLFARIVALMRAPVVVTGRFEDASGPIILHANEAAERLVSPNGGTLMGQPFATCLEPTMSGRIAHERLRAAARALETLEFDLPLRRPYGQGRLCRALARPLGDADSSYLVEFDDVAAVPDRIEPSGAGTLLDGALYGLSVDEDGRVRLAWLTGTLAGRLGADEARLIGDNGWRAAIDPDGRRGLQRRNQRLIAGQEAIAEYTIGLPDGQDLHVRDRARPVFDAQGDLVIGAVGAVIDVTAERAARADAVAARRELEASAAALQSVICRLDASGVIVAVSGRPDGIWSGRLKAGQDIGDGLGPREADSLHRALAACLAKTTTDRIAFSVRVGEDTFERYEVRIAALDDTLIAQIRRDADADRGMSVLLNRLSVPVLALSRQGRVTHANAALCALLERQLDTLHDGVFADLLRAEMAAPELADAVDETLSGGGPIEIEASVETRAGFAVRLRWRIDPWMEGVFVQAAAVVERDSQSDAPAMLAALRAMADASTDAMVIVDGERRIEALGAAAALLTGYRSSAAVGLPIDRLLQREPDGPRTVPPASAAAIRRRDGTILPVSLRAHRMGNYDVLVLRDAALEEQAEIVTDALAFTDIVTALPNRMAFADRLAAVIAQAREESVAVSVLLVDLDGFRLLNTALGLQVGNTVLRQTAARIVAMTPSAPARLEGDGFLVLIEGGAEKAETLALALRAALKAPITVRTNGATNGYRQDVRLTACIGIACYPRDGDDVDLLMRNAESALDDARGQGPDRHRFYTTDMNARAYERLAMAGQLRRAIEAGEFVLHYQPQVDLASGRITAAETLLRWRRSDTGLIPPREFLPVAEETGLIVAIGEWVFLEAFRQAKHWREHGFPELRVAVNLSARQFRQDDVRARIEAAAVAADLPPDRIDLELDETMLGHDPTAVEATVAALKANGFGIVIGGFGTGGASLASLRRLRPRAIKLGRDVFATLADTPAGQAVAQGIVAIAHETGAAVVAEMIETRDALDHARALGCDAIQGYLMSGPVPPAALEEILRRPSLL